MKIDSQHNLSVASKQATNKKSQIESPDAPSFGDLLKGATSKDRPKVAKPDDKPPVESKKPVTSSKKTSTQKKRADQNSDAADDAEAIDSDAAGSAENQPSGKSTDETDTTIESDDDTCAEKEEPAETVAKTDTAEISNLAQTTAAAAVQPQVTDSPVASDTTAAQSDVVEGTTEAVTNTKASAVKTATGQSKPIATDESVVQSDQAPTAATPTTPLADPAAQDASAEVETQDPKKAADANAADQKNTTDTAPQTTNVDEKSAQALEQIQAHTSQQAQPASHQPAVKAPEAPQQPLTGSPDVRFAEDNHPQIVSGIKGELLPNGGSMTLKLDPPELGALQVQLHMRDGTMTATFQTSNDDATRMLSHSLSSLKSSLEAQGINVDKLQVQQAPKEQQTGTNQDHREQSQGGFDNQSARQEQQRKEMLQRMWRKLSGVEDPLDMVA